MSNVSIYVVDLKRVTPVNLSGAASAAARSSVSPEFTSSAGQQTAGGVPLKSGHHVRKSFVKGKPGPNGAKPRYEANEINIVLQLLCNRFVASLQSAHEDRGADRV